MLNLLNTTANEFISVTTMLENCYAVIQPAAGIDKLLCIGSTGAGKSTLLNYLNGTLYKTGVDRAGKPFAQQIGGMAELFKVGQGGGSQTLFPQTNVKAGLNYSYCDLAGLGDSRGPKQRVCAASSAQMLSRLPGNIKGIFLVLDIPGFNSRRGDTFKSTAAALARMLKHNPELMDSVRFVITKIPATCRNAEGKIQMTADDIVAEYVELVLDQLTGELTADESALQFVLQQMQIRKDNIIIPDITDQGQSRDYIERFLGSLSGKPSNLYNFVGYDSAQDEFNANLEIIAKEYLDILKATHIGVRGKIVQLQADVEALQAEITEVQAQIEQNRSLKPSYDPSQQNRIIQAHKDHIVRHNKYIARSSDQREIENMLRCNQHLNEEILACEKLKIQGETDAQIQRELLADLLQDLDRQLVAKNQQLASVKLNQEQARTEETRLKQELVVNADLFIQCYRTVRLLDLDSSVTFANFCREFAALNPEAKTSFESWSSEISKPARKSEIKYKM